MSPEMSPAHRHAGRQLSFFTGKRMLQTLPSSAFSAHLDQASFLFFSKQASNRRFDALSLGAFVQRVLAAVTAAGVTGLVLQRAKGYEGKS